MHIGKFLNNGREYLRLINSRREKNDKGQIIIKKQIIYNIGPLSRFDDGQPDYLERLRESFRQGKPLIESLRPYVDEAQKEKERVIPQDHTLVFRSGTEDCIGHPKCVANMLLERIFTELGLTHLFAQIKSSSKIEYDLLGLVRLLVYGRLLEPASKIATIEQNDSYYQQPTSCANPFQVYNVLDVIYENRNRIIRSMNTAITKKLNRNSPEREGKILEAASYLRRHMADIAIRASDPAARNGGATEPHVSHVLSERLSSRPKGWSERTLQFFAPILANGPNVRIEANKPKTVSPVALDALKRTKEAYLYRKAAAPLQSSFQVILSGKRTELYKALLGVAHNCDY